MKAAGDTVSNTGKSAAAAGKTVRGAGDVTGRMAEVFQSHPSSLLIILLCAMLLILMGSLQSCTPLAQSVLESLIIRHLSGDGGRCTRRGARLSRQGA